CDAANVSSRLSDRRPRARGEKEAASMLTVAGAEVGGAAIDGPSLLDEIAREGARRMLVAALEVEVAAYLDAHHDERDAEGHALVVRNGRGRTVVDATPARTTAPKSERARVMGNL